MFDLRELTGLFAKLVQLAERAFLTLQQTLQLQERVVSQHYGDKLQTRQEGPLFGSANVAPSTTSVLILATPPDGYQGAIVRWANSATEAGGGEAWATTPTTADGLVFQIRIGGRAYFRQPVNSPHGYIGQGTDQWIPFGSNETIELIAINLDAVRTLEACGQLWLDFTKTYEGRRG